MKNIFCALCFLAVVLVPMSASAELIYLGDISQFGSGLGHVSTVLTLNSPANTTDAIGSVTCDTTLADGCTDVVQGDTNAINQTRSFAEAGLTDANDFRLIFNANEPGNDTSITIDSLSAFFYTAQGDLYHTAVLTLAPQTFEGKFTGLGEQGQVFGLTLEEATLVRAFFDINNRIGVAASLSNTSGGHDSFNVGMASVQPPAVIPEPASLLLLGTGILGLIRRCYQ